jgi:hypothetical protein
MAEPAKVSATPGAPPLVTAWIAGLEICSCPKLRLLAVLSSRVCSENDRASTTAARTDRKMAFECMFNDMT